MNKKKNYHVYAIITTTLWATSYVFTRILVMSIGPQQGAFIRNVIASIVLIALALVKKIPMPKLKDYGWFFLSGALGVTIYQLLLNYGMQRVDASIGSIIIASVPISTAVVAAIFIKERIKLYQWLSVIFAFMGILYIGLVDVGGASKTIGVVCLLIASTSYSCYNVVNKVLMERYTPIQVTIYSIITGTILLAFFAKGAYTQFINAPIEAIGSLIYLAVFSSAVGIITWFIALEHAPNSAAAGIYLFFGPIITSVLGYFVLKEVLDMHTIIGAIIIIIGIVIFNKDIIFKKKKHL